MIRFQRILEDIAHDNESGSILLLEKLLLAHEELERVEKFSAEDRRMQLSSLENYLVKLRDFPVVCHYLGSLKEVILGNDDIQQFIRDYHDQWKGTDDGIADQLSKFIDSNGKTILVHSNSGTVLAYFRQLLKRGMKFSVIQTESRPVMEGRRLAEAMAGLGIKVKYITDAAAALHIKEADMVLCGADRICRKAFYNKTGTYALALLAKEFEKPFYVLADSRKFREEDECCKSLNMEGTPDEIWPDPPQGVEIRNYYFEPVPISLVNALVSEKGGLLWRGEH